MSKIVFILLIFSLLGCSPKPYYSFPDVWYDKSFYKIEGLIDSITISPTEESKITRFSMGVEEVDTCFTYYIWKYRGQEFKLDSIQVDTVILRCFYIKDDKPIYFDPCSKMIGRIFVFED